MCDCSLRPVATWAASSSGPSPPLTGWTRSLVCPAPLFTFAVLLLVPMAQTPLLQSFIEVCPTSWCRQLIVWFKEREGLIWSAEVRLVLGVQAPQRWSASRRRGTSCRAAR